MKIDSNTKISEILKRKELVKVLEKYNFPCLSCPFIKEEMENLKLSQVCRMYNIDEKKLIKELNKNLK